MPSLPTPPPGFQLVKPQAGLGRPIIQRNPQPTPQFPEQRERTRVDVNLTEQQIKNAQLEEQLRQLQIEKERVEAAERERKTRHQQSMLPDAREELLNVIDAASRSHLMSRRNATATGSLLTPLLKSVPSTAAKDVSALLNTVGAGTAFDKLQRIRAESPTGGAVGQVSDRDMELLKSSIASLDQSQSDEQFQANMRKVINSYGRVLLKLPGGREAYTKWRRQFGAAKPQQGQGGWSIEEID